MTRTLAFALLFTTLAACGDKDDGGDSGGADGTDGTDGTDGADGGSGADGEALYATSCAACHGASGEGVSGPAMGDVVPGMSEAAIIDVIQNGEGSMPAVGLSDGDAAAVAQYLIATFG
jgi:mono/diheme cytochrome c family protein